MSSKYDSVKTAADLVLEVSLHGLSTAQEDICRAQDIFGNASIDDLDRLANDIGRNNENGDPDPKGSWSSDRRPTQETFYFIAFNIWNWRDATRFFNEHTNPDTAEAQKNKVAKEHVEKELAMTAANLKQTQETLEAETKRADEEKRKSGSLEGKLAVANKTIVELKAKLYDCMSVGV